MKNCAIVVTIFCMIHAHVGLADAIKSTNVAGGFYTNDAKELAESVDQYIADANVDEAYGHVDVAIAPHAGYMYSGAVAGFTFKALSKAKYKTVVVLAPSHYFPFKGAAIWPKGSFATPLGNVAVDESFIAALKQKTDVVTDNLEVFEKEHALEVQLPFIQRAFPKAKIVPILLGNPDINVCEQLAIALNELMGKNGDVLVIASSDLSHYLPYEANNARDVKTMQAISNGDIEQFWYGNLKQDLEMCGFIPVTVAMMLAKLRGLTQVEILKHANSGDVTGDKSRVVGYAAIVFLKSSVLNEKQRDVLLKLARRSVETFVTSGKKINPGIADSRLNQTQGAFVTINKNGQLRGCIGNVIGQKPLSQTVADMAVAAASQDPRFPPVGADELKDINVEVSVLSVPKRVQGIDQIELGRDGVIISVGDQQGLFLPQVATETGWSKEQFLGELCSQKAGLAADCYKDPSVNIFTFTAEVFHEK